MRCLWEPCCWGTYTESIQTRNHGKTLKSSVLRDGYKGVGLSSNRILSHLALVSFKYLATLCYILTNEKIQYRNTLPCRDLKNTPVLISAPISNISTTWLAHKSRLMSLRTNQIWLYKIVLLFIHSVLPSIERHQSE